MKFLAPVLFAALFAMSQISATSAKPRPFLDSTLNEVLGLVTDDVLGGLFGGSDSSGLELTDLLALQALGGGGLLGAASAFGGAGLPLELLLAGGLPLGFGGPVPYGASGYGAGGSQNTVRAASLSGFGNTLNEGLDINLDLK